MFDDLIKAMEKLDGASISIDIETDEKGYIDKQCPVEECEFLFKVYGDDWTNICKDEAIWCPQCRHEAPSDQWFTLEQVEHSKKEAEAVLKGTIHNAMISDARKFNRKQPKGGFVTMSLKVSGGHQRTHTLPAKAAEEMQLEIQCNECSTRFSVVGSAFFCPACGHNSVERMFRDSLRKIQSKKDNLSLVRSSLSESVGKDDAEITCRSIMESCLSDGVVAFQKYAESCYSKYGDPPFNAFQRLEQGSKLWEDATGKKYSDWLSAEELQKLNISFQKRHLLAHNEGIVDSKYLERSGDVSYKDGQRIVITENDIESMVCSISKLAEGIAKIQAGTTQSNQKV